jgi:hypothetical protein
MGKAAIYQILIESHLSDSWSDWFEGMSIRHQNNGNTVIEGHLPDQCALHGVLMKIRNLGLTLVEVKRVKVQSLQFKEEGK